VTASYLPPLASYPTTRLRRNRRDPWSRKLVAEHVLTAADLIWPVFVHDEEGRAPVPSMPEVYRMSLSALVDAAGEWIDGMSSKDYPGYDKVIAKLKEANMESMVASGAAWIGSPREIVAAIGRLEQDYGKFEHASLQINFNTISRDAALASLRLFGAEVLPHFADAGR